MFDELILYFSHYTIDEIARELDEEFPFLPVKII